MSGRVDAHRGIRHRRSQAGGHCDEELLEKSMEAVVFACHCLFRSTFYFYKGFCDQCGTTVALQVWGLEEDPDVK